MKVSKFSSSFFFSICTCTLFLSIYHNTDFQTLVKNSAHLYDAKTRFKEYPVFHVITRMFHVWADVKIPKEGMLFKV